MVFTRVLQQPSLCATETTLRHKKAEKYMYFDCTMTVTLRAFCVLGNYIVSTITQRPSYAKYFSFLLTSRPVLVVLPKKVKCSSEEPVPVQISFSRKQRQQQLLRRAHVPPQF